MREDILRLQHYWSEEGSNQSFTCFFNPQRRYHIVFTQFSFKVTARQLCHFLSVFYQCAVYIKVSASKCKRLAFIFCVCTVKWHQVNVSHTSNFDQVILHSLSNTYHSFITAINGIFIMLHTDTAIPGMYVILGETASTLSSPDFCIYICGLFIYLVFISTP